MNAQHRGHPSSSVDLYWIPLGAGAHVVRTSGRLFESLVAAHERRERQALFHSALEVRLDGARYVIEMTPAWDDHHTQHGAVCSGPVGFRLLGHSQLFRYQVRRWRDGAIPDAAAAVDSPLTLSCDRDSSRLLLSLAPRFPTRTWGRDELDTGEMWNSNSLTSWLLARSGHDLSTVAPPAGGRAPGWAAGLTVAARAAAAAREPVSAG